VRRPFPEEPIRTLDAIHLATALLAKSLVPDLALLSLDERVRRSATQLGLTVLPVTTAA
jgi:predicted nucleic acid-binding protein